MVKPFEIELLNERFDVLEDEIWHVVSLYWEVTVHETHISAFGIDEKNVVDIRKVKVWAGDYDGMFLEVTFPKDGNRQMWIGTSYVGDSPYNRREYVMGFIEVRRAMIKTNIPVDVRIVCSWKPFYLFFSELAITLRGHFKQQPVDQAIAEVLDFKSFVERQTHKDIYAYGHPKENVARALLQAYLIRRSYREVQVRGGNSDILVFDREGRFLYETKIWRGSENFTQGLCEIEEYIIGEDTDKKLAAVFYMLFDPTASAAAHKYLGSDLTTKIIANHSVHIISVNINPPIPSKKLKKSIGM
jgi:hypothetical protein